MNICITGGSGFIGRILCEALSKNCQDNLLILSRKTNKFIQTDQRFFEADLLDIDPLKTFVKRCDFIFHCAGEINDENLMYGLHVVGTRNLLSAVMHKISMTGSPVHWIQLSSTGAYGDCEPGSCVTEKDMPSPNGTYEITKTISDELVMACAEMEPLFTYTILRPSIVVGALMPNKSFFQMGEAIRHHLFFYIGFGNPVATYVEVEDVVKAMILCKSDSRAVNRIFIISNDSPLKEVVNSFASAYGTFSPFLRFPPRLLTALVKLLPEFLKFPLTESRINALVREVTFSSDGIKELGFSFGRSIPEAIPQLLAIRNKITNDN